ncbi:hypothetical protein BACEGG_01420 [Bacteroides eggerthii DSM 20697]|nr:hypothetical protein BACEGG_01420 [Bacteroides eggerthii DSM 20697]
MYVAHRGEYTLVVFLRGETFQALFFRDFHVDAETVGIKPSFHHEFAAGAGNTFQVDITIETVHRAQVFGDAHQAFHSIIGITHHAAAKKQTFDIVAAVELHSKIHQFAHGKSGSGQVIRTAVNAVGTIVNAVVRQHHLQQRNAAPVLGKAMADAPAAHSIPHHALFIGAHSTTGRTGDVILCRFYKYLQLI